MTKALPDSERRGMMLAGLARGILRVGTDRRFRVPAHRRLHHAR